MRRRLLRLTVVASALAVVVAPSATAQPPVACTIGWLTCLLWSCPFSGWPPAPLAIVYQICCTSTSCFLRASVVGCC